MPDPPNIDKVHIEVERKLLNLMLRYSEVVSEVMDGSITADFFSEHHKPLAQAIFYTAGMSEGKRLLTDKHFRSLIIEQGGKGDIAIPMQAYHSCRHGVIHSNSKDDLDLLVKDIIEAYVYRSGIIAMRRFNENVPKMGYVGATRQYRDDLNSVIDLTEIKKSVFFTVNERKDEFMLRLKEKRENPHKIIRCGIHEIDKAMNVGFKPGHTSLFISATGVGKTNMMLNIALELHRNTGKQVLFLPLEMDWEDFITRMVSNTTEISYTKVLSPNLLSEAEIKKIEESKVWFYENFGIIDTTDSLSLSGLRRELDKRIHYFKPVLVVVDYLALVKMERSSLRHDLALGELAKGLKFMGKHYGFHVMTAAQLGRADIKRIREEGADAQLDSTAVKDSQELPSHAEFVFALTSIPDEENRIKIHQIKSRYGPHGYTKELHLNADICKIVSTEGTHSVLETDFGLDIENKLNTAPEVVIAHQEKKALEFQTSDYELDDIG